MSAAEELGGLGAKLDVLIRLQAAIAVRDMTTQREKIVFLYGAGLGPTQIAGLLGTTPKTVSVGVARHRKGAATTAEQSND